MHLWAGPNTKSDVFVFLRSREIRSDIIQFSVTCFGFFSSESDRKILKTAKKCQIGKNYKKKECRNWKIDATDVLTKQIANSAKKQKNKITL